MTGPLDGKRVVVTREDFEPLEELLAERGALPVHLPLIAVVEPDDGGAELRRHLDRLADVDWLVVTSPAGAARVGDAVRAHPTLRLAAVGTSTARELAARADREVDVVPADQRAAALGEALEQVDPARMLLALADRAPSTLPAALEAAGHTVTVVTAYRTVAAPGGPAEAPSADALLLASGSAAEAWAARFGSSTPPVVVAIGPTTAAVAARSGLKVSAVATDHSLTGLVAALERCFPSSAGAE